MLQESVAQKGQRAVARESGIALLSIQRYLKGIGEPTTASLEKLSDYFGESVEWLRGGKRSKNPGWGTLQEAEYCQEKLANLIDIYQIVPKRLKETVKGIISSTLDETDDLIKFHSDLSSELKYALIGLMCDAERIAGLKNWRGNLETIAKLEELQRKQSLENFPPKKPSKDEEL